MQTMSARLLHAYGDAKFGDEWWPNDARAWMGEDEAEELAAQLSEGFPDPERAAFLLELYGETKFADKWRPDRAGEVIGQEEAMTLSVPGEPPASTSAFCA